MLRYIVNRFIVSVFTLLILVTLVFLLVRLLPGDPFTSEKMTPEVRNNMMNYYGLDKPLHIQYLRYLGNLARGDLGTSMKYANRRINDIIAQAFPYSADLGIRSILLAVAIGLILGIAAALNRGKAWDYLCMIIAIIGVSVPDFVVGYLLQFVFGIKLHLLPVAQWKSFRHTILPVFALSLYTLALISRIMRSSMLEVVSQDYVKTAKSKGLSPFQVVMRHQVRNAILPVVTLLGPITASVLTGTFVVELIFAVPGMGKWYVLGIQNLDYSMILGMTVFYGIFLIFANFIVDVLYGFIDPRIKVVREGR
ncbi:MAG: ABC transporter permease [Clostridia bacterium]|nr:ABC transporter permease [Clostridia bacterium]